MDFCHFPAQLIDIINGEIEDFFKRQFLFES